MSKPSASALWRLYVWAPSGAPGLLIDRSANPRTVATLRLAADVAHSNFSEHHTMKKLVPDPPPALCVGPGLSHEEAITRAVEHLTRAILKTSYLPDPPDARHREMLSDAVLNMRISKALLAIAQSPSSVTIPV